MWALSSTPACMRIYQPQLTIDSKSLSYCFLAHWLVNACLTWLSIRSLRVLHLVSHHWALLWPLSRNTVSHTECRNNFPQIFEISRGCRAIPSTRPNKRPCRTCLATPVSQRVLNCQRCRGSISKWERIALRRVSFCTVPLRFCKNSPPLLENPPPPPSPYELQLDTKYDIAIVHNTTEVIAHPLLEL